MEKDKSKKELIIQAALTLFSNQGYHQTSVSQIAEEAGVAKGTVYWYFESKEQLFQEIMLSGLNSLHDYIKKEIAQEEEIFLQLEIVVESFLKFFERSEELARIYKESTNTISQQFREKMEVIREKYVEVVAQIIEEGIKDELLRADLEVQKTAEIFLGMLSAFNPLCEGGGLGLERKIEHMMEIFLKGMGRD